MHTHISFIYYNVYTSQTSLKYYNNNNNRPNRIYTYMTSRAYGTKRKKKRFAKSVAGKSSRRFRLLPVICRAHDNASWARASVLARNRVRCLYIIYCIAPRRVCSFEGVLNKNKKKKKTTTQTETTKK